MGLSPIIFKNCSCCKKSRRDDYYKGNGKVCVPCLVFCNGGSCRILKEELIEFFYDYKKYFVRKSDIDNKCNKLLILPDGTIFDLTQMYIDTTDKHGNRLDVPCLVGSNPDYEVWGRLPILDAIKAGAVG